MQVQGLSLDSGGCSSGGFKLEACPATPFSLPPLASRELTLTFYPDARSPNPSCSLRVSTLHQGELSWTIHAHLPPHLLAALQRSSLALSAFSSRNLLLLSFFCTVIISAGFAIYRVRGRKIRYPSFFLFFFSFLIQCIRLCVDASDYPHRETPEISTTNESSSSETENGLCSEPEVTSTEPIIDTPSAPLTPPARARDPPPNTAAFPSGGSATSSPSAPHTPSKKKKGSGRKNPTPSSAPSTTSSSQPPSSPSQNQLSTAAATSSTAANTATSTSSASPAVPEDVPAAVLPAPGTPPSVASTAAREIRSEWKHKPHKTDRAEKVCVCFGLYLCLYFCRCLPCVCVCVSIHISVTPNFLRPLQQKRRSTPSQRKRSPQKIRRLQHRRSSLPQRRRSMLQ